MYKVLEFIPNDDGIVMHAVICLKRHIRQETFDRWKALPQSKRDTVVSMLLLCANPRDEACVVLDVWCDNWPPRLWDQHCKRSQPWAEMMFYNS